MTIARAFFDLHEQASHPTLVSPDVFLYDINDWTQYNPALPFSGGFPDFLAIGHDTRSIYWTSDWNGSHQVGGAYNDGRIAYIPIDYDETNDEYKIDNRVIDGTGKERAMSLLQTTRNSNLNWGALRMVYLFLDENNNPTTKQINGDDYIGWAVNHATVPHNRNPLEFHLVKPFSRPLSPDDNNVIDTGPNLFTFSVSLSTGQALKGIQLVKTGGGSIQCAYIKVAESRLTTIDEDIDYENDTVFHGYLNFGSGSSEAEQIREAVFNSKYIPAVIMAEGDAAYPIDGDGSDIACNMQITNVE